jgi:hypothetical protein
MCSTGKSGSFFYYSTDGEFMVKTVSKSESHFFRKILAAYFHHLETNPNSLITRFYGHHKLLFKKKWSRKRIYIIVMANLFS